MNDTALLEGVVTSTTRINVLVRLFTNPGITAHLRGLAAEFNVSTNAVRQELDRLSKAKLLVSTRAGRRILYKANQDHPLFRELSSMVSKVMGIDQLVENFIERLGQVNKAFLVGNYAEGKDTGIIDLVLVGQVDRSNLDDLVTKTEGYIKRKIRVLILSETEYKQLENRIHQEPWMSIWEHS